ncbi:calcium-translocating P-type ATPase, PMCA-type family protein [Histomonas meleagridis]|uniref:calcium-translocating P-type ATPase, PMCA-type family protein n=1 Tax=Histomonas meleagridis TaxID=135588 RepID=UPI003559C2D4|nr:calcium-translocating P-type ATPase, PMCA-type family protein [Histomonas meleagridis]KAH0805875.1 calcium-translocating P-type ATPase, PMCA-type family protein [Histomonas meleagridis]
MNISPEELQNIFDSNNIRGVQSYGGVEGLSKELQTDLQHGIDPETISQRILLYGNNDLPEREAKSFFTLVKEAMSDDTIVILIICAIVSLVLELIFAPPDERSTSWIDGTAILAAVIIVSFVQAYSNRKQELQFVALNRIKSIFDVAVVRKGSVSKIKSIDVVVGDIIRLEPGDKIPADGVLIEGDQLLVDQSSANGESESAPKDENDPFLISDTIVTDGRGTMMALCVGLRSYHGRIFELINEDPETTPLQEKLEALATQIGAMGFFAASLTFIVLVIFWIIKNFKNGWHWGALREVLNFFIVSLTIVACAVPEGLPLAVTISLAYSIRKMMSDNNFVRHLSSCETMGSATVICTDKTGTLTKNQMNVEEAIINNKVLDLKELSEISSDLKSLLINSISINTNAIINKKDEIGSQTECALLRLVNSYDVNYEKIRNESKIVKCFQFDRQRKIMSTIEQQQNDKYIVYVKGAPEEILKRCTHYICEDGHIEQITDEFNTDINELIDAQCEQSYRTIGIAYKYINFIPETNEISESDLILITVLCIRDSLRKNTIDSVKQCQKTGVRVIMITGDYMITAKAIAKECHILTEGKVAITGEELRHMNHDELLNILPKLAIVARSTPMDKHLLVKSLQENGEIVGVTGDGTNDVAALMAANVGLAMGCGTELAKEASDIVILDNDFKSIVKSIAWGRCIFHNIQRFLQFQLTTNVSTLFISFLSACFLNETPFSAVQLLWVNLIMDSFGALALATGKPHKYMLKKRENQKNFPLITSFMLKNIIFQATFQIIVIILIIIFPRKDAVSYGEYHFTYLFTVFVLCQVFNLINARATEVTDSVITGLCDTPLFFFIMSLICVVQFLLVQVLGKFCNCTKLCMREWISAILIASISLPLGVICRFTPPISRSNTFVHKPKSQSGDDNVPLLSSSDAFE